MGHGNLTGLLSTFTRADGSQHEMADVWFGKDKAPAAPTAADLLVAPAADLLASPVASAGTATAHAATEAPLARSSARRSGRRTAQQRAADLTDRQRLQTKSRAAARLFFVCRRAASSPIAE